MLGNSPHPVVHNLFKSPRFRDNSKHLSAASSVYFDVMRWWRWKETIKVFFTFHWWSDPLHMHQPTKTTTMPINSEWVVCPGLNHQRTKARRRICYQGDQTYLYLANLPIQNPERPNAMITERQRKGNRFGQNESHHLDRVVNDFCLWIVDNLKNNLATLSAIKAPSSLHTTGNSSVTCWAGSNQHQPIRHV